MLAMDVNDNAGHLIPLGAWATIASKLAPTHLHTYTPTQRVNPIDFLSRRMISDRFDGFRLPAICLARHFSVD